MCDCFHGTGGQLLICGFSSAVYYLHCVPLMCFLLLNSWLNLYLLLLKQLVVGRT